MQVPLRLLFAFTLLSSMRAQVTWTQFRNSFRLYPGTGPGGCDRNAPNGVAMKTYVLASLNDAWTASNTVTRVLPTAPSKRNIRGLLYLLFGITWTPIHFPNPNDGSATKFNYILGTLEKGASCLPHLSLTLCRPFYQDQQVTDRSRRQPSWNSAVQVFRRLRCLLPTHAGC